MRTKTLLLTAALTAAGALTSMAQVYSVNIVGYVNVTIPSAGSKFSLIANQLNNSPDNSLTTLFPAATTPDKTAIYKYTPGSGFSPFQFDAGAGVWLPNGTATLNPGEGAFIFAPTAFTATFVGEVQLSSSLTIPSNTFVIVSSVIPQAGFLHDTAAPGDGNTDLGFGTPQDKEAVYQYSPTSGYTASAWDNGAGQWFPTAAGPQLAVGEAFFNFMPSASGSHTWNRTFSVGP